MQPTDLRPILHVQHPLPPHRESRGQDPAGGQYSPAATGSVFTRRRQPACRLPKSRPAEPSRRRSSFKGSPRTLVGPWHAGQQVQELSSAHGTGARAACVLVTASPAPAASPGRASDASSRGSPLSPSASLPSSVRWSRAAALMGYPAAEGSSRGRRASPGEHSLDQGEHGPGQGQTDRGVSSQTSHGLRCQA